MRVFKFRVPLDEERILPNTMTRVSGCIAVVRAENEENARAHIRDFCAANKRESWDPVADVTDETDTIGIITIAM